MKIIQVPMNEKLLQALNRKAKVQRLTRAELIRVACQQYLRRLEEEELERRYVEGYRRKPEKLDVGKAGAQLAGQIWSREGWDEAR